MISVLFENDTILKETSFSLDLLYQSKIRVLKRKDTDIVKNTKFLKPDILFIEMLDNSIDLIYKIKSIKTISNKTKIVLLLEDQSDFIFWMAKRLEINGVLLKTTPYKEFIEEIISTATKSKGNFWQNHEPIIEYEQINKSLSDVEKQIIKLIGKGLTTQDISSLLCLSKRTIDNHRARILKKLNCNHASKLIYLSTIYNLFNFIRPMLGINTQSTLK